ncbi:histone-like nucleoid-structuring protein Lsr2 [Pseudarthrobacter sp. NS4]|uniref:histone-like nucleoid-structuring protein Lsr2 n=1 Tax=Pseudarthrobacter sp. NS4 TaxID=2973976 RepID=UPI00216256FC|nr:Lsr2 family protein [Pseudarthrobacter sp. NS4]
MVTRTVIELIDDLDGSQASETIRFGLDGTDYEIDLTEQNAGSLRSALARYVEAGRKGSSSVRRQVTTIAPAVDTKAIRHWAADNGVAVNPRGRIKEDVVQQYLASLS